MIFKKHSKSLKGNGKIKVKLIFKFEFYENLTSLWKGSFQKICEKEVKLMINGVMVLKGYLKSNCKGKD